MMVNGQWLMEVVRVIGKRLEIGWKAGIIRHVELY